MGAGYCAHFRCVHPNHLSRIRTAWWPRTSVDSEFLRLVGQDRLLVSRLALRDVGLGAPHALLSTNSSRCQLLARELLTSPSAAPTSPRMNPRNTLGCDQSVVAVRTEADGERARLVPAGTFDLAHASAVVRAVEQAERNLISNGDVDLHLSALERIDGSGALVLARLIDRLEARGHRTRLIGDDNSNAVRLITLYRERAADARPKPTPRIGPLARFGVVTAALPGTVTSALDFLGQAAAAVPRAFLSPRSVDWSSLPRLMQAIGADALPVTSAANLLVGLIIGFLGVAQLRRFGAVVYVPELVVVAHFRELGPLVTAIIVAGRSGAGLASELATMQVSEEIDALRSMGFHPVSWLVVPRCLALVITLPLLTWIGDALALGGGLLATSAITDLTPRAYVLGTAVSAGGPIVTTWRLYAMPWTGPVARSVAVVATALAVALLEPTEEVIVKVFPLSASTRTGPKPAASLLVTETVAPGAKARGIVTSTPSAVSRRICLVRVIVPEMTLASVPANPYLGHPRYYELPRRLGLSDNDLTFADLNPDPIPFP